MEIGNTTLHVLVIAQSLLIILLLGSILLQNHKSYALFTFTLREQRTKMFFVLSVSDYVDPEELSGFLQLLHQKVGTRDPITPPDGIEIEDIRRVD